MKLLNIGVEEVFTFANPVTGDKSEIFALPDRMCLIGIQYSFDVDPSAITFDLDVSVDGVNFSSAYSSDTTGGRLDSISFIAARFGQIHIVSITGGSGLSVSIIPKVQI